MLRGNYSQQNHSLKDTTFLNLAMSLQLNAGNMMDVKSQVLPSMKKTVVYNCCIVFNKCGSVVTAYDGCPAGIDGRCKAPA